jgi:hypothetical protein
MSSHRILGRGTRNSAGMATSNERTAAIPKGGTSSSAHRMGTNVNPHTVTTASAIVRSRGVRLVFRYVFDALSRTLLRPRLWIGMPPIRGAAIAPEPPAGKPIRRVFSVGCATADGQMANRRHQQAGRRRAVIRARPLPESLLPELRECGHSTPPQMADRSRSTDDCYRDPKPTYAS